MGLLGDSWDDPRTMGTLQLAAGLLSPGSLGQGISRGLLGYQQSMKAAQDMEVAQTEQALRKAQVDQAMQKTKAELYAAARKQQFLGALGQQFAGVTPQQALAAPGQMAPTPANPMQWPPQPAAARPDQLGPTLERAELIGQRTPVDWQQMMAAGMAAGFTPEQIKALAEAPNLGRQKVARTAEVKGPGGKPVIRQFDEYGNVAGEDAESYKNKEIVNFGDFRYLVDTVTGQRELLGRNGMTPGEAASNSVARGNLAVAQQRMQLDKTQAGKPEFHDGNWVFRPDTKNPQGLAVPVTGMPQKLGEGQKKQLSGIESLNGAIGEYLAELDGWSNWEASKPDGRARMGTKYNNMMLQAKEAYNLGVLNGPDLDILQSVVTNPTSLRGAFISNKALRDQAKELQRLMDGTARAVRGGGANAGGTAQGGQPEQQKSFEMLPPANQYPGRRAQASNGTVYKSDGKKWIKE